MTQLVIELPSGTSLLAISIFFAATIHLLHLLGIIGRKRDTPSRTESFPPPAPIGWQQPGFGWAPVKAPPTTAEQQGSVRGYGGHLTAEETADEDLILQGQEEVRISS